MQGASLSVRMLALCIFTHVEMSSGEIIRKAGLKSTPQRKMIYEIMAQLGHSSIDDVIVRVQQKSPEMTLSTIYRILDSFCKAGLLSKINHPNGKCHYDVTILEHQHVFMDNEVIDYTDSDLTALVRNHLEEKSFKLLDSIQKISIQIIVNRSTIS